MQAICEWAICVVPYPHLAPESLLRRLGASVKISNSIIHNGVWVQVRCKGPFGSKQTCSLTHTSSVPVPFSIKQLNANCSLSPITQRAAQPQATVRLRAVCYPITACTHACSQDGCVVQNSILCEGVVVREKTSLKDCQVIYWG